MILLDVIIEQSRLKTFSKDINYTKFWFKKVLYGVKKNLR
jgi:hypothetical protein